jgi:hypothetical protein
MYYFFHVCLHRQEKKRIKNPLSEKSLQTVIISVAVSENSFFLSVSLCASFLTDFYFSLNLFC